MKIQKVVVILPVYGGDKLSYLIEAVESLLKQTYNNFSLLIAVDGPISSNLKKYIENIDYSDRHIQYYTDNRGLPSILNDSIKYCFESGAEFIVRMDADDISAPDRLEKQIHYLKRNPGVSALGTCAHLIDEKSNVIGEKKAVNQATFKSMLFRSQILHATVVFRKSFFEKVGFYDISLRRSQDYDLWLRALKQHVNIQSLKDNLYFIRYDETLISRRKMAQMFNLKIKRRHFSGGRFLISILPHLIISITPEKLISLFLSWSIRTNLKK